MLALLGRQVLWLCGGRREEERDEGMLGQQGDALRSMGEGGCHGCVRGAAALQAAVGVGKSGGRRWPR